MTGALRCLGCGRDEMVQARELFTLDVVDESHREPHGFFGATRTTYERRVAKTVVGYVVVCVACGLQQSAKTDGMHHVGAVKREREERDEDRAPSTEEKPPLRTVLDKDIPLRRRGRPYA